MEHAQQEEAVVKIKEWIHESANLSKIQKCQINLNFAKAKKILAKNRVCQIIEFEESAICVILNSNSALNDSAKETFFKMKLHNL